MVNFCHIAPTAFLDMFCKGRDFHLTLAHLVETDQEYVDWYVNEKASNPNMVNIMDNGGFEMFKQNRPMYPSSQLIEMGKRVDADYIVLSDYPSEPGQKTIDAAVELAPQFRKAGFGTFFVPQSKIGDKEDLIKTFEWAATSEHVDYIGVSILGVPNAYGVEKGNKLQRWAARWKFVGELEERGIIQAAKLNGKLVHFLGMVDGYREIELVKDYVKYIDTWDSSAAVWAGLHGIEFDDSPTGMVNGKFEKEVEFDFKSLVNHRHERAMNNVRKIDELCKKYSGK